MGSDAKERLLSINPWVDLDWPERCKQAAARITELEAALAASNAERDDLQAGLSSIVHCQSSVTRAAMREAAAWALRQVGKKAFAMPDQSPFAARAEAAEAEAARLREALTEISDLRERPYMSFPADWHDQIAACSECQSYKGHPIQQGICNEHRRPLYARDRHDADETRVLGYRCQGIAKDALRALAEAKP